MSNTPDQQNRRIRIIDGKGDHEWWPETAAIPKGWFAEASSQSTIVEPPKDQRKELAKAKMKRIEDTYGPDFGNPNAPDPTGILNQLGLRELKLEAALDEILEVLYHHSYDVAIIDPHVWSDRAKTALTDLFNHALAEARISELEGLYEFAKSHDSVATTTYAWERLATLRQQEGRE